MSEIIKYDKNTKLDLKYKTIPDLVYFCALVLVLVLLPIILLMILGLNTTESISSRLYTSIHNVLTHFHTFQYPVPSEPVAFWI